MSLLKNKRIYIFEVTYLTVIVTRHL